MAEPIPVPKTKPIEIPIPIPLTVPIDKTKTADPGPYNVYDIHVNEAVNYGDYERGIADPTHVYLTVGEIYKYGITKFSADLKRYEAFS